MIHAYYQSPYPGIWLLVTGRWSLDLFNHYPPLVKRFRKIHQLPKFFKILIASQDNIRKPMIWQEALKPVMDKNKKTQIMSPWLEGYEERSKKWRPEASNFFQAARRSIFCPAR